MLRHDWLAHGPTLSVRLNSTTTTATSSSVSLADQQGHNDYEKVRLRTTPTKIHDKSLSPTNSLVELELHTSSFFDTARLRNNTNNNNSSNTKEQQRRNRASAIPDSTRYNPSNNTKTNSSSSRPPNRRPLSLSLDDQHSNSPIDYHFASTSEKTSLSPPPPPPPPPPQAYTRRSRRTVSPTYGNNDRVNSPQTNHRYTLVSSPETTRRTTSPINPSRYLVSYDFDTTLRDLKRKPIYKYTPPIIPPVTEINVVPSLLNFTKPVAPSVFTTAAIKFTPTSTRRMSSIKDQDTNTNTSSISPARLLNNTISNPSSTIDNSINTATTNYNNRRSLLASFDLPSTPNNIRKSRLLDDNNNFISLKVHE
jgi:hypothetical protein